MSLETWKAEFYPIDANEAAKAGPLAAAKHSLQKWIGLREENLKKHGVIRLDLKIVFMNDRLWIDNTSCSLCQLVEGKCEECPFEDVMGTACGREFSEYRLAHDPEPMIESLEAVVKHLEEKE